MLACSVFLSSVAVLSLDLATVINQHCLLPAMTASWYGTVFNVSVCQQTKKCLWTRLVVWIAMI